MKYKLILLVIVLFISTSGVFATQGKTVISDSDSKKELSDAFNNVNRYTNNFFTPHARKRTTRETDYTMDLYAKSKDPQTRGSIPPVKKLRLMLKRRNKPKKNKIIKEPTVVKNQAILDCDVMEYFADRAELEAKGHVLMSFPANGSSIKCDKLIYNQTTNLIKAFGNIVLFNGDKKLFGDYMQIDLNEENAVMDNPISEMMQVKARAKKGYLYGDKVIQEQGSIYITKKTMLNLRSQMFGPNLSTMYINPENKSHIIRKGQGGLLKIKTNDLIINAKKDHDTVTLNHAEIYFKEKKIGTIPTVTIHTNKSQDYVESNIPEFGTTTNLGSFVGPGFVFDVPGGSTLKLIPILNNDRNKLGFGGLAKFKSATNKTDMGYGTSNGIFIMRGLQKLDDNLFIQYASNAYMDDWFMGYRMSKMLGEIIYQESFDHDNFLGPDKDMRFTQRASAAYAQDGNVREPLFSNKGGIGTLRFKYMTEVAQTLYKFNTIGGAPINTKIEVLGQTSTAVYGTGDTQVLARIGPRIHTQYKNWMQDVGYFQSGYSDNTPLKNYDRYMYGRSNAYFRESMRICKYLTASWFTSLNFSQDRPNGKMQQENGFYFAIGPDDLQLNIGYDTVRQQSFITMAMSLDAKDSSIEYKKMVIKNPERLGKTKNETANNSNKDEQQSFETSKDDESEVTRAEVVNLEEVL